MEDNLDWKLDKPVALAPRDKRLWRIATGKDGRIHTSINGGGTRWDSEGIPNNGLRSAHAPALAGNGATMTLLLRGNDGFLYTAEYDGSWATIHKVTNIALKETPATVYFGGNLHVMYRRTAT
ncbi:hypothetical protein ACFV98_28895 [Streptomyces violascens]|uniref:hypothetical protein n=1 Tax=Streptomyces violascens TaxID=67381 RepID=UPI003653BBD2